MNYYKKYLKYKEKYINLSKTMIGGWYVNAKAKSDAKRDLFQIDNVKLIKDINNISDFVKYYNEFIKLNTYLAEVDVKYCDLMCTHKLTPYKGSDSVEDGYYSVENGEYIKINLDFKFICREKKNTGAPQIRYKIATDIATDIVPNNINPSLTNKQAIIDDLNKQYIIITNLIDDDIKKIIKILIDKLYKLTDDDIKKLIDILAKLKKDDDIIKLIAILAKLTDDDIIKLIAILDKLTDDDIIKLIAILEESKNYDDIQILIALLEELTNTDNSEYKLSALCNKIQLEEPCTITDLLDILSNEEEKNKIMSHIMSHNMNPE